MQGGDRDLELALLRTAWRLDALDKWREQVDADLALARRELDGLVSAQVIAEKVADELHSRNGLSWWQKLGAAAGGALVLADAVKGLVH